MKLSIITINYNNREGLLKTIKSIIAQTYRDFEYIIIDGGSTDGSVDVIKEYSEYIDYWVSEPDKGIYNAMNKGVQVAHGDYCQFLNSGDWLYSSTSIENILPLLNGSYDIISSYTNIIDHGHIKRLKSGSPYELTLIGLINRSLSHPSSFIKRDVLIEYPYDDSLKIVADWKFFIEAYINKMQFCHVDLDIAFFDTSGISSSNHELLMIERTKVLNEIPISEILNESSVFPSETILLYESITESITLKKVLHLVIKFIVSIYSKILFVNSFRKRKIYNSINYPGKVLNGDRIIFEK